MVEFSIIIPVYNAQQTLQRCLDSILAQSFDNYEVLLMDDGSNDESYHTCQNYQDRDKRFKAYHQENKGPSAARNFCLNIALGKWICFIDSDDFISNDYLEQLHKVAEEEDPDGIFVGYRQVDKCGNEIAIKLPTSNTVGKYEQLLELSNQDMFGYTWIKSFKRECIGKKRFREDLNLFEDEVFACAVLASCEKVSILRQPIYNYVVGNCNALTQQVHHDYCQKCEQVFVAWKQLLENYEKCDEVLQDKANMFVTRCRYYGFERAVDLKSFFADLADTGYFKSYTLRTKFDCYVQNRNFRQIKLEKQKYLAKVKLSNLLKK